MKSTKIEWTEKVWNPSVGCSKISAGCRYCYAETFARRLQAMGVADYSKGFEFRILPHRLEEPLKIKKPSRFFVNSMSDLFHEKMPFSFLDHVFYIIEKTPQHIFQILTKRDLIMLEYFSIRNIPENVWLGVTIESSGYKSRIESLKKINASVRFVSFEPLIDSVGEINLNNIHWAIVGGESGPRARPIKEAWVDEIFNQCQNQNVAFFFKQWGTWGKDQIRRNKKANGRLFKGAVWNEFPV